MVYFPTKQVFQMDIKPVHIIIYVPDINLWYNYAIL